MPWWRIRRSAADRELERSLVEVKAAVQGFVAQARARLQEHATAEMTAAL